MKKISIFIALALTAPSYALLPPLYESLAEFKALINDERLPGALDSGELIVDIKKDGDDFVVTTNKRAIRVQVVREETHLIGPGKFHFDFPAKSKR